MLLTYYVDKKCMVYLLLNCWKKRSNDVSSSLAKAFQYITITKKWLMVMVLMNIKKLVSDHYRDKNTDKNPSLSYFL